MGGQQRRNIDGIVWKVLFLFGIVCIDLPLACAPVRKCKWKECFSI